MLKFNILLEDEDLILVDKPAGLLSIPDRYQPDKPNLYHLLHQKREQIFTVHRLDKDTSGLICFAKNETAHKVLSHQFEERTIIKRYIAIVDGRVNKEEDTIDKPIGKDPSKAGRMIISKKGKPSLTQYKVLERFKGFSLIEAKILTGRTHQIRVHFASIGHPLAIDPIYGQRKQFYLSEIKRRKYRIGKDQEERPLVKRQPLHALALEFNHPTKLKEVSIQAELPKDIKAMVNQLRKWNEI